MPIAVHFVNGTVMAMVPLALIPLSAAFSTILWIFCLADEAQSPPRSSGCAALAARAWRPRLPRPRGQGRMPEPGIAALVTFRRPPTVSEASGAFWALARAYPCEGLDSDRGIRKRLPWNETSRGSPPGESIVPSAFGEPPRSRRPPAVPAAGCAIARGGGRREADAFILRRAFGESRRARGTSAREPPTRRASW